MLKLNVLYLKKTDLATEEDKKNNLVYWAELFKATTWEDLIALCDDRPEFEEVATAMYKTNTIPQERTIMEAHERYVLDKQAAYDTGYYTGYDTAKEEYQDKIDKMSTTIEHLKKLLAEAGIKETE